MAKTPRIVVIEDEPDILEVLSYNLKREGFKVKTFLDGSRGMDAINQKIPDQVLLDLMLPGIDGLEVCHQLKSNSLTRQIPIIMVTAKGEESDVVLGLGVGADDYITKPFSPREMIARVKAVLRRQGHSDQSSVQEQIECNGLLIDAVKYRVSLNDDEVRLTATEFKLLHYLASHPGRVFTREQLLNHAFRSDAVVVDRNIDVHVRSIRKKLGEGTRFIETMRGIGYRFREIE